MQQLHERCGNKFSQKTVLMLGQQLVSILQYFHFKNFIHNQVKPSNIMLHQLLDSKIVKLFNILRKLTVKNQEYLISNFLVLGITEDRQSVDEMICNLQSISCFTWLKDSCLGLTQLAPQKRLMFRECDQQLK